MGNTANSPPNKSGIIQQWKGNVEAVQRMDELADAMWEVSKE